MIGLEDLPTFEKAGMVIYQQMKVRCSMRLPPTLELFKARERVNDILTQGRDDDYNAQIDVSFIGNGTGFNAP